MLLYLIRLADVSGVDLGAAVQDKLAANAEKWVPGCEGFCFLAVWRQQGRGSACDGAAKVPERWS